MTDASTPAGLAEAELRNLNDTLARIDAEATVDRLRIFGVFFIIAGAVSLLVLPVANQLSEIGREATIVLAFVATAVFLAGNGATYMSYRFRKKRPIQRAEEQIARLISGTLNDDAVIAAAVRLLLNARGPKGVATNFEVSSVAEKLGDNLSKVREVERELVARGLVLPVFTAA